MLVLQFVASLSGEGFKIRPGKSRREGRGFVHRSRKPCVTTHVQGADEHTAHNELAAERFEPASSSRAKTARGKAFEVCIKGHIGPVASTVGPACQLDAPRR
jgi:hypothetical protein